MSNATDKELAQYIESIERCEAEKAEVNQHLKDIRAEMKSRGYDMKAVAQMLKERKMENDERENHVQMCDLYRSRLGALGDTPLGQASIKSPIGSQEKAQEAAKAETATQLAKDLETAALEGRQAGRSGSKVTENPYLFSDPRHGKWEDGWKSTAKELVAA